MKTYNTEETILLGEKLAGKLKPGDVVALFGNLGSGKTTFTKGIGKGLGVKNSIRINSPTFVLIREYEGRIPLYHFDLYRLGDIKDMEDIDIKEYIAGGGVTVIEWAEKAKEMLPKQHISVRLLNDGKNTRRIYIKGLRL